MQGESPPPAVLTGQAQWSEMARSAGGRGKGHTAGLAGLSRANGCGLSCGTGRESSVELEAKIRLGETLAVSIPGFGEDRVPRLMDLP